MKHTIGKHSWWWLGARSRFLRQWPMYQTPLQWKTSLSFGTLHFWQNVHRSPRPPPKTKEPKDTIHFEKFFKITSKELASSSSSSSSSTTTTTTATTTTSTISNSTSVAKSPSSSSTTSLNASTSSPFVMKSIPSEKDSKKDISSYYDASAHSFYASPLTSFFEEVKLQACIPPTHPPRSSSSSSSSSSSFSYSFCKSWDLSNFVTYKLFHYYLSNPSQSKPSFSPSALSSSSSSASFFPSSSSSSSSKKMAISKPSSSKLTHMTIQALAQSLKLPVNYVLEHAAIYFEKVSISATDVLSETQVNELKSLLDIPKSSMSSSTSSKSPSPPSSLSSSPLPPPSSSFSSSSPSSESNDSFIHLRPAISDPKLVQTWPLRAPIVAILGHVDHGKTTLLDTLRGTTVAASEAGGITQHIGAFEVFLSNHEKITFLDTPGHAAFENLRERGAQLTDLVVLVVAADDGVMPQTIEAIRHIQAAKVPMIVALNKCDRQGADVKKAQLSLLQHGIQVEDMGGDVMCIPISALKRTGIDHLEEAILTLSELLELRGDPQGALEAVVIESQLKKGVGPVATVLVKHGTLRPGDILVAGETWCRVRYLISAQGKRVSEAGPSTPVEVHGWKTLPFAGHPVYLAYSEDKAKKYISALQRTPSLSLSLSMPTSVFASSPSSSSSSVSSEMPTENVKRINVGVKGDVTGSVEALVHFVQQFRHPELHLNLLFSGVGPITPSELDLAHHSEAVLLGLNIKLDKTMQSFIQQKKLTYVGSNIIYRILDQFKAHLVSYLTPHFEFQVIGQAHVLQLFSYQQQPSSSSSSSNPTFITVLGCKVMDGLISKQDRVRILRHDKVIWEGPLKSIRHFKKEVKEINKGNECGLVLDGFEKVEVGDTVECFKKIEIPRTLD